MMGMGVVVMLRVEKSCGLDGSRTREQLSSLSFPEGIVYEHDFC